MFIESRNIASPRDMRVNYVMLNDETPAEAERRKSRRGYRECFGNGLDADSCRRHFEHMQKEHGLPHPPKILQ